MHFISKSAITIRHQTKEDTASDDDDVNDDNDADDDGNAADYVDNDDDDDDNDDDRTNDDNTIRRGRHSPLFTTKCLYRAWSLEVALAVSAAEKGWNSEASLVG